MTNPRSDVSSWSPRREALVAVGLGALLAALIPFDTEILRWYRGFDPPAWAWPLEQFASGSFQIWFISLALVAVVLSGRQFAVAGVAGLGIETAMVHGMKFVAGRVRPCHAGDWRLFLGPGDGHSGYPSGHAAMVWFAAFLLAHRYPMVRWPAFAAAGVVSWARLHAGAHFPTDIVAGAAVGWIVSRLALSFGKVVVSHEWAPMRLRLRLTAAGVAAVLVPAIGWGLASPSPPHLDRSVCELAIRQSYQSILGREPDAPGLASYLEQLGRDHLVIRSNRDIALSTEFFRLIENEPPARRVDTVYERVLDRPPTASERVAAAPLLASNERLRPGLTALIQRLFLSEEYQSRFGPFGSAASHENGGNSGGS
ncbi:MAG: phosphatase PAP2 family protein [Phycisphaerales bacterium]